MGDNIFVRVVSLEMVVVVMGVGMPVAEGAERYNHMGRTSHWQYHLWEARWSRQVFLTQRG